MGHANTTCLISGLSIGYQKVLCVILAPTKTRERCSNALLSENKIFYPLTMPIKGKYSADEFSLESYEGSPWSDNLVAYFKKGVKKDKQDEFNLLSLLRCIGDHRYDSMGSRAEWFDIKNPNELCELTKTLEVAYIDYDLFQNLEREGDEKKEEEVFKRVLNHLFVSFEMIKDDRKKKNKKIYWDFLHMESDSHDLFLEINEEVFMDIFDVENKKDLQPVISPFKNLMTCTTWLFNLGRPWTPSSSSHQDGENENIVTLSKIVSKIVKNRSGKDC